MENFPSVQVPLKDLRLLLRRINKCIRELGNVDATRVSDDPESQQIANLIYSKAYEMMSPNGSNNSDESADPNDLINIFNELI